MLSSATELHLLMYMDSLDRPMITQAYIRVESVSGSTTLPVPFIIRYHPRASRITIRVSVLKGVVITVPSGAPRSMIDSAIHQRGEWIIAKLDELRAREEQERTRLVTGAPLSVLGNNLFLQLEISAGHRPRVWIKADRLMVRTDDASEETVRRLLCGWLRKVATHMVPRRVAGINREHGFVYSRVCVRDQKTRWGSCSKRGTLSFNWRVVLLPTAVMDYLIVHELAHLREMNHSARFWGLVETLCPEFRTAEQWLRRHGRKVAL